MFHDLNPCVFSSRSRLCVHFLYTSTSLITLTTRSNHHSNLILSCKSLMHEVKTQIDTYAPLTFSCHQDQTTNRRQNATYIQEGCRLCACPSPPSHSAPRRRPPREILASKPHSLPHSERSWPQSLTPFRNPRDLGLKASLPSASESSWPQSLTPLSVPSRSLRLQPSPRSALRWSLPPSLAVALLTHFPKIPRKRRWWQRSG